MAATAMVHVRVSGKVKAQAEKALAAMGLSTSDAVRMLLTLVAAEKALPFDVHVPNARTRRVLREARTGKLRRAASVDDLMTQLNDGA
jgi:DNA-damage-inducible protein J